MSRIDKRADDELRPVVITPDFLSHPLGSMLIGCGRTRVVCAASLDKSVPPWMKARKVPGGWLTAEYGMLPASTNDRMKREASSGKQGGRTVEIQRLIGRSLRMSVDLLKLNENTMHIDCDVIDADGGTRCASITGASAAVAVACRRGMADGLLTESPFCELVAAVSVGVIDGVPMLDLCYEEDSRADVDMNVVMTESGRLVEVQGTAEGEPFSRSRLNELLDLATVGLEKLFAAQHEAIELALSSK
ncbi:MAG: ribonuclease PH [Victivallaceae bacterium]|nr:ribonuclease PH [Victivallaceae bacterium]